MCPAQEKGIVYNDEKKIKQMLQKLLHITLTEQRLEKNWYLFVISARLPGVKPEASKV